MKVLLGSLVGVAMTMSGAALAQEAKSADEYVCQFSPESCGETDGFSEGPVKGKPPTKGFSLTRGKPAAQPATQQPQARSLPAAAVSGTGPRALAPKRQDRPTQTVAVSKPLKRSMASAPAKARGDLSLSFELGSANLTGVGKANARAFAEALKRPELASSKVLIEGHTDRSGDYVRNVELSKQRAQAVKDYLISLGISPDRLQAQGFGPDKPIPGASADRNRRVEAELVS
jgi:outer membrane protein OmpA-like peptidoglycan-associated protein